MEVGLHDSIRVYCLSALFDLIGPQKMYPESKNKIGQRYKIDYNENWVHFNSVYCKPPSPLNHDMYRL